MASLAQVYILDIPYSADKPYTYYFHAPVAPGDLVEVPFGKGNRVMTAVVHTVTEGEPDEKTKPIAGICVEGLLSAEMLGLCLFMKEYTLCTDGQRLLRGFRKRGRDPVILHDLGKRRLRGNDADRLAEGTQRVLLHKKA